jgi:hypothetical protein
MFQEICDKFWIDIRENPFNCDCEMKDFIDFLSETNFTGKSRYEYLYDLKCFTKLSYIKLYNLAVQATADKLFSRAMKED